MLKMCYNQVALAPKRLKRSGNIGSVGGLGVRGTCLSSDKCALPPPEELKELLVAVEDPRKKRKPEVRRRYHNNRATKMTNSLDIYEQHLMDI